MISQAKDELINEESSLMKNVDRQRKSIEFGFYDVHIYRDNADCLVVEKVGLCTCVKDADGI